MSNIELKEKLIEKIKKTENNNLLGEAYRLLEMEMSDIEIYKLSNVQRKSIDEAKAQIKKGEFLTDANANKEISEWLKK